MSGFIVTKGVKTKLFGTVLVFLGVLDSMLSWRGGLTMSGWYTALIGSGLFLYALGTIRGRAGPVTAGESPTGPGHSEGDTP